MHTVHQLPVEAVGKPFAEHRLGRLQRHALVNQRTATDAGRADRGHVLAHHHFQQADVRFEGDGPPEQGRRGRACHRMRLSGADARGKVFALGPRFPAAAAFENQYVDTRLREPQRRDAAAKPEPTTTTRCSLARGPNRRDGATADADPTFGMNCAG